MLDSSDRWGFGSVVKQLTADQGIASYFPSHQLSLLKEDNLCTCSSQKKCPRVSLLYKNLVWHVWWAYHDLTIWVTNRQ